MSIITTAVPAATGPVTLTWRSHVWAHWLVLCQSPVSIRGRRLVLSLAHLVQQVQQESLVFALLCGTVMIKITITKTLMVPMKIMIIRDEKDDNDDDDDDDDDSPTDRHYHCTDPQVVHIT